ncbi:MAG: DinB family protein [Bacteroidota bacterium]
MSTLRTASLADLDLELATTRRVLERIPSHQLDWRPHEKSMSIRALATHIANLLRWWRVTLLSDGLDMAVRSSALPKPTTSEEILDLWDQNVEALRPVLADLSDEDLRGDWSIRMGDKVLSTDPRHLVMRRWGMSHIIHHRGQLSVYLRLLDVPVPSIYGPTADERPGF